MSGMKPEVLVAAWPRRIPNVEIIIVMSLFV